MNVRKLLTMWAIGGLAIVGVWVGVVVMNWFAMLGVLVGLELRGALGIALSVVVGPIVAYGCLQACFPGARPMRAPWRRALAAFRDTDVAHDTVSVLRERGIRAQLAGRSDIGDVPGGLEITVPRRDFSAARDVLRELKRARVGVAQA